jgi:hypothetical protein
VNALLRSITCFTAIALLVFVGLHAVVPHDHPHTDGTHFSEVPPMAHAENKFFLLLLVALLPFLFVTLSRTLVFAKEVYFPLRLRMFVVPQVIPIRWDEALRKGRIHSRAD